MAEHRYRGWADPVKACLVLRDAVTIMVTAKSTENYRVKMDRATDCLCLFRPEDHPQSGPYGARRS